MLMLKRTKTTSLGRKASKRTDSSIISQNCWTGSFGLWHSSYEGGCIAAILRHLVVALVAAGKREVKGEGSGEADREKEASVRRSALILDKGQHLNSETFGSNSVKNFQPVSNIRGVFDVEEASEARESRFARGGFFKIFTSSNKIFYGHYLPVGLSET